MSRPLADRFCAAGFSRSQSATKFVLLSVHARVVLVTTRLIGLSAVYVPAALEASRYLPRLALIAVFPFPNRSYAAPKRGVRSLKAVPLVAGNVIATGMNLSGPNC